MIELEVDSVRVSLLSPRRLVVLREPGTDRYLPIWIGTAEADAITIKLQNMPVSRPLTHDLLKSVIEELGANVSHIVINDLVDNAEGGGTFLARIVLNLGQTSTEVDSRPSDAIALAVRVGAPIFADESVMIRACIKPSPSVEESSSEAEEDLAVFRDFMEGLEES
jgi:hypothetical protein